MVKEHARKVFGIISEHDLKVSIVVVVLVLLVIFNFASNRMPLPFEEPNHLPFLDSDNIVVFDADVFDELKILYSNSEIELLFCLLGEKLNGEILITDIQREFAAIAGREDVRSTSEYACQRPDVVGTLHFHLMGSEEDVSFLCEPSITDVYTFGTLAVQGNHIIQAVQCGPEQFSFFDTSIGGSKAFEIKTLKWEVRESTMSNRIGYSLATSFTLSTKSI